MKKKLLSFLTAFLAVVMASGFIGCNLDAEKNSSDGEKLVGLDANSTKGLEYTLSDDDMYYIVSGMYTPVGTDVVISASYNGLPVKEIGERAFEGYGTLTSIKIPGSVTSIGNYAFSGCYNLASIEIPDSVKSIGDYVFQHCIGLTNIEIPDSVASIGNYVFSGCDNLQYNEYNNGLYLGNANNFYHALIQAKEFSITSYTVHKNTKVIQGSAFYKCSNLTSLAVESGNTVYHSEGNCVIKTKTKTLAVGCQNSVIPTDGSVTSIGACAFVGCSGLRSIEIPDGVTSIGDDSFGECSGLTNIKIPDSVMSIGNYIFDGCDNLQYNEYDNGLYLGNKNNPYVIFMAAKSESITSCTIHEKTRFLYSWAFDGCSNLASIEIPDGVTSIGSRAFDGCSGLTSIKIPDSVTSIGSWAFMGCSGLTSIKIPDSVTSIGHGAFRDCSGLTSIEIPNRVMSIGEYTFAYCSGLTNIKLSDNLRSIGHSAFVNCSSLTSIKIPDSVTSIRNLVFASCTSLESITIDNNVTSIGYRAFFGCTSLVSMTIGRGVRSIDVEAFDYCSDLTSIKVESGNAVYHSEGNCLIETESKTLFLGCQNSVIPTDGSVTCIGGFAFNKCSGLTSIEIPNSVTAIGFLAFKECSGLTSITFKGTVAEWNAVEKDEDWKDGTLVTEVVCIDGRVPL